MSYKPKFCCECGAKIERIDWRPWTNRKFCEVCEAEYGLSEFLKKIAFLALALFGLYGFGVYLFKSDTKPQIQPHQIVSQNINKTEKPVERQMPVNNAVQPLAQTQTTTMKASPDGKAKKAETASNPADEIVYFCGAQTKKGTPCSRRVKGGGRCWQHAGQKAILPDEKLIASNN